MYIAYCGRRMEKDNDNILRLKEVVQQQHEDNKIGRERIETMKSNEVVSWDFTYFTPSELSCKCDKCTPYGELGVSFKLVAKLEQLRKLYKLPVKINSGFRCKDHPLTISRPESKGISSHAKGLAADISAKTSRERYALVQLIMKHDLFSRIGVSGKDGFMHVDIDKDKSDQLIWIY